MKQSLNWSLLNTGIFVITAIALACVFVVSTPKADLPSTPTLMAMQTGFNGATIRTADSDSKDDSGSTSNGSSGGDNDLEIYSI